MWIICADLEGVFVPEVWINVAKITGIEKLKLTTRDIKDYNELMQYRLKILDEHKLTLKDIQNVIATLKPLDGALEFIEWCKETAGFVIVSDTFIEFAEPLMKQLNRPMLMCHSLQTDSNGMITNYMLRQEDPKRKTVQAFQSLQYKVVAFGDSYNDITMLLQAEKGILYRPPLNVIADYPQLPVTNTFEALKLEIEKVLS